MDIRHARLKLIDTILSSLVLGFASGIAFFALGPESPAIPAGIAGLAAVFLVSGCMSKKYRQISLVAAVFLFALFIGILRAEVAEPDTERFADSIGTTVAVEGIIESPPALKAAGQQFTLALSPTGGEKGQPPSILVTAGAYPELLYGDRISVSGKLELPENFMTDQGTEFDYISYLYKDDILYQIKYAHASVISHGNGNPVIAHLISVKKKIVESFGRILPAREADLLAGLDLGEKSSIDPGFRDDLVATGTIHIIALSGYNVTIVATFLQAILARIPLFGPAGAAVFGALGILFFVTMTGLQSSAVRAGIMALIALFARRKGRTYDAFRALIAAGFLMILWDPKYLVYDVSFGLSFLATLGILFAAPVLMQKLRRVPEKILFILPLRELMAATLGAQAGVLPFILYKMGTLSLISLPANILVLPAVPFAMGLGAFSGLVGTFSAGLAYPFSMLTHLLLKYITGIITLCARVPYASVIIEHFPLALCLLLYIVIGIAVYRSWRFV